MKNTFLTIYISLCIFFPFAVSAQNNSLWYFGGTLKPVVSSWIVNLTNLRLNSITNCGGLGTDADGDVECSSGSGGGSSTGTGALQGYFDNRYVNTSGDAMTGTLTINIQGGNLNSIGLNVLNTVSGAIIRAQKALFSSGTLVTESGAYIAGTSLVVQANNGRVGIGDATPDQELTVNGGIQIGPTASTSPYMFPFLGSSYTVENTTGRGITFYNYNTSNSNVYSTVVTGETMSATSGFQSNFFFRRTFSPTSGTATFSNLEANTTINQTGGASGITRDLYFNPTLTAAADYRAIEVNLGSTNHYGIYQAGSNAENYVQGTMGIGTINSNTGAVRLEVLGQLSGTTLHAERTLTSSGTIRVENGTQEIGISLAQAANGTGINIVTSATTNAGLNIEASSLTTGTALRVYSNSGNFSARKLIEVINDNSGAQSTTALYVQQDARNPAIEVVSNSNVGDALVFEGLSLTSGNGLEISVDDSMTTGRAIRIFGGPNANYNVFSVDEDGRTSIGSGSVAATTPYMLRVNGFMTGSSIHAEQTLTSSGIVVIRPQAGTTTVGLNVAATYSGRSLQVWGTGASTEPTIYTDVSTNRVGFGTATPKAQFQVKGPSVTSFQIGGGANAVTLPTSYSMTGQDDGFSVYSFRTAAGVKYNDIVANEFGGFDPSNFRFFTVASGDGSASERMTITSAGRVGIGITHSVGPETALDVLGTISGSRLTISDNAAFSGTIFLRSNKGLRWQGGSQLYEQSGTARMLYQPNGDRFEVLDEAGSNFIAGFHGGASSLANSIRLYNGVGIGNVAGYAISGTLPTNGLLVAGSVGLGLTSPETALDVLGTISGTTLIANGGAVNLQREYPYHILFASGASTITGSSIVGNIEMQYGGTINSIAATVDNCSTNGKTDLDVLKNGTTVFSTRITIDSCPDTSTRDAAVPSVLSTTTFVAGDKISFFVRSPASTPAQGLKVYLNLTRTKD